MFILQKKYSIHRFLFLTLQTCCWQPLIITLDALFISFGLLTMPLQCRSEGRRGTTRSGGRRLGAAGGPPETGPRWPRPPGYPPSWTRCCGGSRGRQHRPAAWSARSRRRLPASATPATPAMRTTRVSWQVTLGAVVLVRVRVYQVLDCLVKCSRD